MVITCHLCTYHNTRIIAYQIGWCNFSMHAKIRSSKRKPRTHKGRSRKSLDHSRACHACAPIGHALPNLARRGERAYVRMWFFLFLSPIASTRWRWLNCLSWPHSSWSSKVGLKSPTFPYMHACVSGPLGFIWNCLTHSLKYLTIPHHIARARESYSLYHSTVNIPAIEWRLVKVEHPPKTTR